MNPLLASNEATLNDIDPQACLADALARMINHPVWKIDQLWPWNRKAKETVIAAAE
ncbi:transposase domain-containing protein [Ensifer sp. HO-A22]|uniref:Transposase domain-containing protein n=1 Tax=Ensifer oleiphilus TaxID=2742698 RepID=A0A7Y6Q637_9HYPH|nr:transposase domain-containing protein [Ensifer oleiphilus]NVD39769.1 transposase domain-containing protein [Ensifer oleiphilus]